MLAQQATTFLWEKKAASKDMVVKVIEVILYRSKLLASKVLPF